MILILSWLTVSLPFLTRHELQTEQQSNDNFPNSSEENNTGNISFAEEFVHHQKEDAGLLLPAVARTGYPGNETAYEAFHGELLSPPPNFPL